MNFKTDSNSDQNLDNKEAINIYPSWRIESNCLLFKCFTSPWTSIETSSKSSHVGMLNKFSTAKGFLRVDAEASLTS